MPPTLGEAQMMVKHYYYLNLLWIRMLQVMFLQGLRIEKPKMFIEVTDKIVLSVIIVISLECTLRCLQTPVLTKTAS